MNKHEHHTQQIFLPPQIDAHRNQSIYQSLHPSHIHLYIKTASLEAPPEAHTTLSQAKSHPAFNGSWTEG